MSGQWGFGNLFKPKLHSFDLFVGRKFYIGEREPKALTLLEDDDDDDDDKYSVSAPTIHNSLTLCVGDLN